MPEAETLCCPRRAESHYPWNEEGEPDQWLPPAVRWVPGRQIPLVTRNGVVESWHIGWETYWPSPPRTCSFCGCAHPADVIEMMKEGWEAEVAKPGRKWYLNPPGTQECREKMLKGMRANPNNIINEGRTPVPPVKIYAAHLTKRIAKR